MASQGPLLAGAGSSSGGDFFSWNAPSNITADDDTVSSSTVIDSRRTKLLTSSSHGFSIPSSATITGVIVEIEKRDTGAAAIDWHVNLVIGGTVVGTDKAAGGTWPTSLTVSTYGGSTDLWGVTPTVAEINASNCGVALQAWNADLGPGGSPHVDFIRITVHYSLPTVAKVYIID